MDSGEVLDGTKARARLSYEGKEKKQITKARGVRSVREGDAKTTVNTQQMLPVIDSHCHLGGMSLSGGIKGGSFGTTSHTRWNKKRWARKIIQFPIALPFQLIGKAGYHAFFKRGITNFIYYNASSDKLLVDKLMPSMTHFCREVHIKENVAACAMVLDMGFVALNADAGSLKAARLTGKPAKHREHTMILAQAERDRKAFGSAEQDAQKAARAVKQTRTKLGRARIKLHETELFSSHYCFIDGRIFIPADISNQVMFFGIIVKRRSRKRGR